MKTLLSLLITFTAFSGLAQTTAPITDYFDKDWKSVTDHSKASYYRTIEQNDKGYIVHDYYISGKVQMIAACKEVSPRLHFHGKRTLYYENGNIQEEGEYRDNREAGAYKWYYENGNPKKEVNYRGEKTRYLHYWSEAGDDELADGDGVVSDGSDAEYDRFSEIKNFEAVDRYSVRRETGDTIYMVVDEMPEYPGGYEQMMNDIRDNLTYPTSARKRGLSGTVYISFIIGKNGDLRDFKVLRGFDPECDAAALKAVSALKPWHPGKQKKDIPGAIAKPVAVRFNLPIKFTLKR